MLFCSYFSFSSVHLSTPGRWIIQPGSGISGQVDRYLSYREQRTRRRFNHSPLIDAFRQNISRVGSLRPATTRDGRRLAESSGAPQEGRKTAAVWREKQKGLHEQHRRTWVLSRSDQIEDRIGLDWIPSRNGGENETSEPGAIDR